MALATSFLIIDTCYPSFLTKIYDQNPGLCDKAYAEQWQFLMGQCFGTADYYSSNLKKLGFEATEVIANCQPMQIQWSREQGLRLPLTLSQHPIWGFPFPWYKKEWFYPILMAQIKRFRPDILYIQDPVAVRSSFLHEIRPYVRCIVGQIASPIQREIDFSEYNLVLSSLPNYVDFFRRNGRKSLLFRLGFEATILGKLVDANKEWPVTHIGGYGPVHQTRNNLLEALIERGVRVDCWGYGISHVPSGSRIRRFFHGETWGLGMYQILHDSRISLNAHIAAVAGPFANNMRLYEATGVGTLLITDWKQNLMEMFEPGKEVVAYQSIEECLEQIEYYLSHEEEREKIAHSGQQRTLREHTYYHRMQELVEIVRRYL